MSSQLNENAPPAPLQSQQGPAYGKPPNHCGVIQYRLPRPQMTSLGREVYVVQICAIHLVFAARAQRKKAYVCTHSYSMYLLFHAVSVSTDEWNSFIGSACPLVG